MKKTLIWIFGFIITVSAATYQKLTGPTHNYRQKVVLNGENHTLRLARSGDTTPEDRSQAYIMVLKIDDPDIQASITYRRYPTNDDYKTIPFEFKNGRYEAGLKQQPAAGKLEYTASISDATRRYDVPKQIMRFKDPVPFSWLLPHILTMFLAMFFSNVTGLMAIFNAGDFSRQSGGILSKLNTRNYVNMTILTIIFFAIGGLFLGPVVQKYAFGDFWTGIPFGMDLTDNKTLIAAIFWAIALFMNARKPSRAWTLLAVVVMMAIYAIPHSMFGSELDPDTGKVIQGVILPMNFLKT